MPKSPISEEMIQRIAKLAALELTVEEQAKFAQEIGDVLFYFEKLAQASTEGVELFYHPFAADAVLRADEVRPRSNTPMIDCAPDAQDGGFKVPQVL
jgi:aspartyl-tRNA(Asn)/glutamyl-tRNA(Gln) amidotransferase subunit C